MAESILAGIAQELTLGQLLAAAESLLRADQLPATPSGALRVGNSSTKFRDQCNTLDLVNTWKEIPENSPGVTIDVRGETGGASYLNFDCGTVLGAARGLISRESFTLPLRLSVGLSASQRIVGTDFYVELVEVDDNGDVVTDTALFSAPAMLDARNAVGMKFSGSSTSNSYYTLRSQGGSELVSASVSYGTAHLAATGADPNYFSSYQFDILLRHDLCCISSRLVNSAAAPTTVITRTDLIPDPTARYAIRIRSINSSTPTSATNYRLHFVRALDASTITVDFSLIGGIIADMMAAPVKVLSGNITATAISSTPYTDTATNLAANATFTGTARDGGLSQANANFVATFFSNQPGSARIEMSTDNAAWRYATPPTEVVANTPLTLKVPVTARSFRVVYTNGATATTALLITSAYQRV